MKAPSNHSLWAAILVALVSLGSNSVRSDDELSARRLITFDPPHLEEPGSQSPFYEEKGIRTDSAYIQNASVSSPGAYPDNGTHYIRNPRKFYHAEGLTFDTISADIAKYSALFADPLTVIFQGTKPGGTVVIHKSHVGFKSPVPEFETVILPPTFTNLKELRVSAASYYPGGHTFGCHVDNLEVVVRGEETPPDTRPVVAPLIYDIDWNYWPHLVGESPAVGGPRAPSYATGQLLDSFGPMTDRPFQGAWKTYLSRGADRYIAEMDLYLEKPTANRTHFFVGKGFPAQRIKFEGDGTLFLLQSQNTSSEILIGNFPIGEVFRFRVEVDMIQATWTILINGETIHSGAFLTSKGDPEEFYGGVMPGMVVDNLRVYAEDPAPPTSFSELTIESESLDFGPVRIGDSLKRKLNIANTGTAPLQVSALSSDHPGFEVSDGFLLQPGESRDVEITFRPSELHRQAGRITVFSDVSRSENRQVSVSGQGIPDSQVVPTESDYWFKLAQGETAQGVLSISNPRQAHLPWRIFLRGGGVAQGTEPARFSPRVPYGNVSRWHLEAPEDIGAGIDAIHAWNLIHESPELLIAILSTGIDLERRSDTVWSNPGEIPENGVDDDGNGYADDVHGWNFAEENENLTDKIGYGDHLAGIITSRVYTDYLAGITDQVNLLPVKIRNEAAVDSSQFGAAVAGLNYAIDQGADIIVFPWGAPHDANGSLSAALERARVAGILVVITAGDGGINVDHLSWKPVAFSHSNLLKITASNQDDKLTDGASFGKNTVHIAVPGTDIDARSLAPADDIFGPGSFGLGNHTFSGTEPAAGVAAGAAALLMTQNPTWSPAQIIDRFCSTADLSAGLYDKVTSGGRMNLARALGAERFPQWLSFSGDLDGTSEPFSTTEIPFSIDTSALMEGSYTVVIELANPRTPEHAVSIPVRLQIDNGDDHLPPLTPPTQLSATDGSLASQVLLTWTAAPGSERHAVYRSTINDSTTATLLGYTFQDSFADRDVISTERYFYWVAAVDRDEESEFTRSELGFPRETTPPTPTGFSASDGLHDDRIVFSWYPSPRATSYEIYEDQGGASPILLGTTSSSSFTLHDLPPNRITAFQVVAVNTGGSSPPARDTGYQAGPTPTPPIGFEASDGTYKNLVYLRWEPDPNNAATLYEVFRHPSPDPSLAMKIGEARASTKPFFADRNVSPGATFSYWVRTISVGGPSLFSSGDSGFAKKPGTGRLDLPRTNSESALGTSAIWSKASMGTYEGLAFSDENSDQVLGAIEGFRLSRPRRIRNRAPIDAEERGGQFSGRLRWGNEARGFRGEFDTEGMAIVDLINRRSREVEYSLQCQLVETDASSPEIVATVTASAGNSDNGGTANARLRRRAHSRHNPYLGPYRYTYTIPARWDLPSGFPEGDGVGVVRANRMGMLQARTILGDGTRFSESSLLSEDQRWMLYRPLYGRSGGHFSAELVFQESSGVSDFDGPSWWLKKDSRNASGRSSHPRYLEGFQLAGTVVGAEYRLAPPGEFVLDGLLDTSPNATLGFFANHVSPSIPEDLEVTWATNHSIRIPNDRRMRVRFLRGSGMISGSFRDPENGWNYRLFGVVNQKQSRATGLFLVRDQSGFFGILPEP